MLEPNQNPTCPSTIVENGIVSPPRVAASLDFEIQNSTPRAVKVEITNLFKNETVIRYLLATYGGHLEKMVVVGKKRGDPEFKVRGNVATVTVSPDAGGTRRFAQQLLAKARSMATSSDNETGESKAKASSVVAERSAAKCFTDRLIGLVQQWARKEFVTAPPSALTVLLSLVARSNNNGGKEVGERLSLAVGLAEELPRISRVSFASPDESIQNLARVIRQPHILKELSSRHKHLCRSLSHLSPDFFVEEKLLDVVELQQHAESIGTLAIVSFLRYLADEREKNFTYFALAVNQLGELIEGRYSQRVALAIERSERPPLDNFVKATSELLATWSRCGVFGILAFADQELAGGCGATNQIYTGLVTYRDRVRQFLVTHDELAQTDVPIGSDPSSRMLNLLRPCIAVIGEPQIPDLRPFKAPLVAFGKELAAFAQGTSLEHRQWYVNAFSGLLEQPTGQLDGEQIDDSPEYVLGMIKDLVVWGNDPHDPRLAPEIVGPDHLLEAVIVRAAYEAGRATFEKLQDEASIVSINQFEARSKVVQELMEMVSKMHYVPAFSLCATVLTHFAKYKFEVAKAEHFRLQGDSKQRQTLLMNAVSTARSCAEQVSQFPIKYQREYAGHLLGFFNEVVRCADRIEKEGEVGLTLTALEPALELLDHLGDKGELRARITKTIEGCINTLVDICQQMSEDREYWTSNPEAAQFGLDGVAEQLGKWQTTTRLAGSKEYVIKHLARAAAVLKKR